MAVDMPRQRFTAYVIEVNDFGRVSEAAWG